MRAPTELELFLSEYSKTILIWNKYLKLPWQLLSYCFSLRGIWNIYSPHDAEESKIIKRSINFYVSQFNLSLAKLNEFSFQNLLMSDVNANSYNSSSVSVGYIVCLWLLNECKPNSQFLSEFSCSWVKKELRTTSLAAGKRLFG